MRDAIRTKMDVPGTTWEDVLPRDQRGFITPFGNRREFNKATLDARRSIEIVSKELDKCDVMVTSLTGATETVIHETLLQLVLNLTNASAALDCISRHEVHAAVMATRLRIVSLQNMFQVWRVTYPDKSPLKLRSSKRPSTSELVV